MTITSVLRRVRSELGSIGLASLACLAAVALFFFFVLQPLETHNGKLEQQLALNARQDAGSNPAQVRASAPAAKMATFYNYLKTGQRTTDFLDRLYSIGETAGVELRSADYRVQKTGTRIERYEIKVPVSGNYAQIRAFLGNALAEIPVLSLDEVKFKKERAGDQSVQADLRLTLHLINP
jgi:hypothetical protein